MGSTLVCVAVAFVDCIDYGGVLEWFGDRPLKAFSLVEQAPTWGFWALLNIWISLSRVLDLFWNVWAWGQVRKCWILPPVGISFHLSVHELHHRCVSRKAGCADHFIDVATGGPVSTAGGGPIELRNLLPQRKPSETLLDTAG